MTMEALDTYAADLREVVALGPMAQFEYLIDVADQAAGLPPEQQVEANRMNGCLATVWIVCEEQGGRLLFRGDSDAAIVKGLVTILTEAFSGYDREGMVACTVDELARLGLGPSLTERRQVGMKSMVAHMRKLAGIA